jgi:hypothetical protein
VGFGTPVSSLSKDGLFVGYRGEAATGRGPISAGVATQGRKHRREHISGVNADKVLRYDLPNLRHAMSALPGFKG